MPGQVGPCQVSWFVIKSFPTSHLAYLSNGVFAYLFFYPFGSTPDVQALVLLLRKENGGGTYLATSNDVVKHCLHSGRRWVGNSGQQWNVCNAFGANCYHVKYIGSEMLKEPRSVGIT